MSKYIDWELYDEPPEGFFMDKHTGSPLTGYDFYTNGKSVLNGGERILVKAPNIHFNNLPDNHHPISESISKSKESKQDPMIDRDVRKKVNNLARNRFKEILLCDLEFDLLMSKFEDWSMESYVNELKQLIDDVYRKIAKRKRKSIDIENELRLNFNTEKE